MKSQRPSSGQKLLLARPHQVVIRYPKNFRKSCTDSVNQILENLIYRGKYKPVLHLDTSMLTISNLDFRSLIELALRLPACREILWEVASGEADQVAKLMKTMAKVPWADILAPECSLDIRIRTKASRLYHQGRLQKKLAQYLYETQKLAFNSAKADQQVLEVRIENNDARLYLSLFGRPASHRGIKRMARSAASIKEELAAALLIDMDAIVHPILDAVSKDAVSIDVVSNARDDDKDSEIAILVPFCGSGTFIYEALTIFFNYPSFIHRTYAFESFRFLPKVSVDNTKKKLLDSCRNALAKLQLTVVACDTDTKTLAAVEADWNFYNATLANHQLRSPKLRTFSQSFEKLEEKFATYLHTGPAIAILNPPYGRRLPSAQTSRELYRRIGTWLVNSPGITAGLVLGPKKLLADEILPTRQDVTNQRLKTAGGFTVQAMPPISHGGLTVGRMHFFRDPHPITFSR